MFAENKKFFILLFLFGSLAFSKEKCAEKKTIVEKKDENFWLIIQSFGEPPKLVEKEKIQGEGLAISFKSFTPLFEWQFSCGEIDAPIEIDFSKTNEGKLEVIQHAFDPRKNNGISPFILSNIKWDLNGFIEKKTLVLEKGNIKEIEIFYDKAKKALNESNSMLFEEALYSLRNMAIENHEIILKKIQGLGPLEGALNEIRGKTVGEIDEIIALTKIK